MKILNAEGLEKLLVRYWTEVLDARSVLKFAAEQAQNNDIKGPINNLTISRFEPICEGFLVWIEFNSTKSLKKVYVTIEALLKLSGELQFTKLDDAEGSHVTTVVDL